MPFALCQYKVLNLSFTKKNTSQVSIDGFKVSVFCLKCPPCREFSYSTMTEKRKGPTPGVCLIIEVSIRERELTVFIQPETNNVNDYNNIALSGVKCVLSVCLTIYNQRQKPRS